jgi:ribonuclease-3
VNSSPSAQELTEAIGYSFGRPALLAEALTHPSALSRREGRQGARSHGYERLEFLGDRVLGLVVADLLWRRFEGEPEGHLTRRQTSLVRRETLARVARAIGLGRHIVLSPAEAAAGAADNPAILADVCEAVIAAIHIDGGFAAAESFVRRLWEPLIEEMSEPPRDPKTALQEWAQARGLGLPEYVLVDTSGPEHALRFTMAARIAGCEATATASSKQRAQELAAARLLEMATEPGGRQDR